MKYLFSVLAALLLLNSISSCKKTESSTPTPAPKSVVTISTSGGRLTADSVSVINDNDILTLNASFQDGSNFLILRFPAVVKSNSLSINNTVSSMRYSVGSGGWGVGSGIAGSGNINLTLYTATHITGTCSMLGKAVSGSATGDLSASGTFDVYY